MQNLRALPWYSSWLVHLKANLGVLLKAIFNVFHHSSIYSFMYQWLLPHDSKPIELYNSCSHEPPWEFDLASPLCTPLKDLFWRVLLSILSILSKHCSLIIYRHLNQSFQDTQHILSTFKERSGNCNTTENIKVFVCLFLVLLCLLIRRRLLFSSNN